MIRDPFSILEVLVRSQRAAIGIVDHAFRVLDARRLADSTVGWGPRVPTADSVGPAPTHRP